jgi:hypothetical protein
MMFSHGPICFFFVRNWSICRPYPNGEQLKRFKKDQIRITIQSGNSSPLFRLWARSAKIGVCGMGAPANTNFRSLPSPFYLIAKLYPLKIKI